MWSRFMRPIVHPKYRAERELAEARMEIDRLTAALAASEKAKNKAIADLADADHVADLRDFLENEPYSRMTTYITRDEEILNYDTRGNKGFHCDYL